MLKLQIVAHRDGVRLQKPMLCWQHPALRSHSAAALPLLPSLRVADLAAHPDHNVLLRTQRLQALSDQLVLPGLFELCAAPVPAHAFAAAMAQPAVTTTACQGRSKMPTDGCDPNDSCKHNRLMCTEKCGNCGLLPRENQLEPKQCKTQLKTVIYHRNMKSQ